MRILIRTSKWAIWARRLGSVAIPLVIISVILHRFRLITSDLFLVAAIGAGLVAVLAILVSFIALARLWQSGDQGWGRALAGLAFGLICLVPYGWYGAQALRYPAVTDIATADRGAMPLIFEPGTAAMPPPKMLTREQMGLVFPNVETRTYPLGMAQTFVLVQRLVDESGWDVRLLRDPAAGADAGRINAQTMTLLGWREEVVIRVSGDLSGSVVDMRSTSLNAQHDFGSNGKRVEAFLSTLDDAVTTLLRDNPNANQPIEADDEDEAAAPPA